MQKYHDEPKQYKGYLKSALKDPAHVRASPERSGVKGPPRVPAGVRGEAPPRFNRPR